MGFLDSLKKIGSTAGMFMPSSAGLSAIGTVLSGIGQIGEGGGQKGYKPFNENTFWAERRRIEDSLKDPAGTIFGQQGGNQLYNALMGMINGTAGNDIAGGLARQFAPMQQQQLDQYKASLNPALRGSGIAQQGLSNLTQSLNSNLYDQALGMKAGLMGAGVSGLSGVLSQEQNRKTDLLRMLQQFGLAG